MLPDLIQKCDATGEDYNVLDPHVVVTVKVQRKRLVDPSQDDENADTDVEPYLGNRSGEAHTFVVKDFAAAVEALQGLAAEHDATGEPLKVNLNHSDDSHLYAEAAAQNDDGEPDTASTSKPSTSMSLGGDES